MLQGMLLGKSNRTTCNLRGRPPASLVHCCGLLQEVLPEKSIRTFRDVTGGPEAKAALEEGVEYLRTPDKFTRLGGKLPKGVLMTGAPGRLI